MRPFRTRNCLCKRYTALWTSCSKRTSTFTALSVSKRRSTTPKRISTEHIHDSKKSVSSTEKTKKAMLKRLGDHSWKCLPCSTEPLVKEWKTATETPLTHLNATRNGQCALSTSPRSMSFRKLLSLNQLIMMMFSRTSTTLVSKQWRIKTWTMRKKSQSPRTF